MSQVDLRIPVRPRLVRNGLTMAHQKLAIPFKHGSKLSSNSCLGHQLRSLPPPSGGWASRVNLVWNLTSALTPFAAQGESINANYQE